MITFADAASAQQAITMYNGQPFPGSTNPMIISLAKFRVSSVLSRHNLICFCSPMAMIVVVAEASVDVAASTEDAAEWAVEDSEVIVTEEDTAVDVADTMADAAVAVDSAETEEEIVEASVVEIEEDSVEETAEDSEEEIAGDSAGEIAEDVAAARTPTWNNARTTGHAINVETITLHSEE